ncbi:helix-turn-helix domain-containing protein [Nocardia terpenica]|nr:helix-turn-helix transcriptional regulator [Nocardia terpenica]
MRRFLRRRTRGGRLYSGTLPEIDETDSEGNELTTGSTLARRGLGRELKRLRERAKVNLTQASRLIGVSPQTIGRMEDGLPTKVSDLYINTLCDGYRATKREREVVMDLALEVRTTQQRGGGWWRPYANELKAKFDHYMALEEAAQSFTTWRLNAVPGLVQTLEYRRAITWTESPDMPPEQVDKRVEMFIRRQARLKDPDFRMEVLLSEFALRDQIGGPSVMHEQLHYLLEASELPNVTIRIVPFDASGHLGSIVGSFALLEFPRLPATGLIAPPVVYVEGYAGDLYLELEADVDRYRHALQEIGRVALGEAESRAFILAVAKEYGE